MLYHSPSLKEFVYPVPVCQPEADLGSILSIFQHLNCKMLAIPQVKARWGILTAENMLSLVAKTCGHEGAALVSQPNNIGERQKLIERSPFSVSAFIEPAMVCPEETKLEEFLDSFQSNSWLKEKTVCLIVDCQGTLQGRLDRSKIIEHLAQKTSTNIQSIEEKRSLPSLVDFLSQIALPAKIEANGQVVSTNQLWLDLIPHNSPTASEWLPASETNMDGMMQWLIKQQEYASNQTSDFPGLGIKVQHTADWNYLKIPLVVSLKTADANQLQYLVIAARIFQAAKTKTEPTAATSIASQDILTAVSHELKSPLTGIVGLSSLLRGQKLGGLNQRQMRYIQLIYRSGKKMMDVVDRLLQINTLIAEQSHSTELINLEFLCRQLYQETITKLRSTEEHCNLSLKMHRSQLSIELGSEVVVANKFLLAAVLSHLLLEALEKGNFQPPAIQIKSQGAVTAISISSQNSLPTAHVGLSWAIAECLSKPLLSQVAWRCGSTGCQFSLLLPKNKTKSHASQLEVSTPQLSSPSSEIHLTILCLYPELDVIDPLSEPNCNPNFDLKRLSDDCRLQGNHQHRIIEADSLEQAHNLARIWRLDAIILNGYQIALPEFYLRSLQEYEHLASLPLITLDARTTEAANQTEGLNVYPCLLPAHQCNIEDLVQVIRIAIET